MIKIVFRLFSIFIVYFVCYGCSDCPANTTAGEKKVSGNIIHYCVDPNGNWQGRVHKYTADNVKISETVFKRGIKNGDFSSFYPSGNLLSNGQYENGKKNGTWKYYHESGELLAVVTYSNGKLVERSPNRGNMSFNNLPQYCWNSEMKIVSCEKLENNPFY